jgi:hypothetical protein
MDAIDSKKRQHARMRADRDAGKSLFIRSQPLKDYAKKGNMLLQKMLSG